MRVEVITDPEGLRGLADEWRALPLPTPMQSPGWLLSWWEAYGRDDPRCELAALAVRDEPGRLAGLAPWYTRRTPVVGATLRQLGDGRASTDHGTILCSPEDEPAVVTAIAGWLTATAGSDWRRVRFEAIDDDDRAMNHLERLLGEAGMETQRIADVGSFPAELVAPDTDPTWENFLAGLSKNRRKKYRKLWRDGFESGRAATRVAGTPSELRELWPTLVRLHRERREAVGERGAFDCPRFERFHRAASERLLAEGRLYLAVLELDGEPVAAEYAPQDERGIYAYQGGIAAAAVDRDAGHLSLMALANHALRAGRTRLDLLRGDQPYKLSWGATHRPSSTLHARPRDAAGAIERWVGSAYRTVRDARRQRRCAKSQSQT